MLVEVSWAMHRVSTITTIRPGDPPAGVKSITMNRHCDLNYLKNHHNEPSLRAQRSNPFNISPFRRQRLPVPKAKG